MKTPHTYIADDLKKWDTLSKINNVWVCSRPVSFGGIRLFYRIKLAWQVFIGKYDVLKWNGDQ